jgi:hypothetical protein
MPDIADLASDEIEQSLERALRTRAPELRPIGACYNCEEPLAVGLFCDQDCRDDHEHRARTKALTRRP